MDAREYVSARLAQFFASVVVVVTLTFFIRGWFAANCEPFWRPPSRSFCHTPTSDGYFVALGLGMGVLVAVVGYLVSHRPSFAGDDADGNIGR